VCDLPPEEGVELIALSAEHGLSYVPMLTPTSTEERIARLAASATSFLYCVSIAGVTGARKDLPADLPAFIGRVRKHTPLPLAVGFGISTAVEFALGGENCLHGERELLVVACATAIPAAFSMVIGLLYMHCSGRKHSEGPRPDGDQPAKGKHLMLVEVPDTDFVSNGSIRGQPFNQEFKMPGNSMVSYKSSQGTSIQIHSPSGNDIAAYQSMNQSSVMSTMRPRGE
jgi:hypothetical protein